MGTEPKAEKADSARKQVPVVDAAVYKRFIDLTNVLAIPVEDRPYDDQFEALAGRLQNLSKNYELWFQHGMGLDKVLYQHLAFTMLVPGGKADRARKAVELLDAEGCFYHTRIHTPLRSPTIARIIRPYVRFHNVKAKRLKAAMTNSMDGLRWRVQAQKSLYELHEYILENFKGLGRKATAHFMRNVGISVEDQSYPIIDVHIHKVLEKMGSKHATYDEAEQTFCQLAQLTGINIILLDAALWCTYARNWNFANSDFDNYGYNHGK